MAAVTLRHPTLKGPGFIQGKNPYSSCDFMADWSASGAPAGSEQNASGIRPVYPPSTLIPMLPLSILPWRYALVLFEVFCSVLYVDMLLRLARYAGRGGRGTCFVAFGLSCAPIHAGLAVGNISVLAFLLAMYSLLFCDGGFEVWAGILLALSLCLKPTLAAPLLLFYLLRRNWRSTACAVVASTVISGSAVLRMRWASVVWVKDYLDNVQFLFGKEGVAGFTAANTHRFDLLNLQVPFYVLTQSNVWANLLAWLVVGILLCWWFLRFQRSRVPSALWASAGALLLIGLLPVYQRNYNAGFVLLPALWGFQDLTWRRGKWMLVLCGVCLVPGEAMLRVLQSRSDLWSANNFLMNFFVLPQLTWAILAMILLLLTQMRRAPLAAGDSMD